jgi:Protein of unknown function (DUF3300)
LRYSLAAVLCCVASLGVGGCFSEIPEPMPAVYGTATTAPQPLPVPGPAPLSAAELDQLVAPIALYPDELVAQALAAATYPAEIVEADRWMQQHTGLNVNALATAVESQPWDPSVKALTQFPAVLAMMDKNLSWTSALGQASMNDSQAVMAAIQQLRRQARQSGNLHSTPQQTVITEGHTIVIEPTVPDVVYVPEFDPWLVYGAPLDVYPGWVGYPGLYVGAPGIAFGLGVGVGLFAGFGWGWYHWRPDWHGHGIFYNDHPYVSHGPAFPWHRGGLGRPGHDGFRGDGGFGHDGIHGHLPPEHPHLPIRMRPPVAFHGEPYRARAGAFSGFNYGGMTRGFAERGRASLAGIHGGFGFRGGVSHDGHHR